VPQRKGGFTGGQARESSKSESRSPKETRSSKSEIKALEWHDEADERLKSDVRNPRPEGIPKSKSQPPLLFARSAFIDYNSAMTWFDEADELLVKWNQAEADREWSKFTPRAQQVFSCAIKEAKQMKLSFIGVEHLLLGLLEVGIDAGVNALRNHGLTLEVARAEILKMKGNAVAENPFHYLHTTPRLSRVMETANKVAKALGHTHVGTEHLLWVLLAEKEGGVYRILKSANIDPATMRNEFPPTTSDQNRGNPNPN